MRSQTCQLSDQILIYAKSIDKKKKKKEKKNQFSKLIFYKPGL